MGSERAYGELRAFALLPRPGSNQPRPAASSALYGPALGILNGHLARGQLAQMRRLAPDNDCTVIVCHRAVPSPPTRTSPPRCIA
jgi:hypothetical protein